MAKSISNRPETTAPASQQASPPSPVPQVQIDESEIVANYANFCRVTGTPEELLLDFGLNPHPFDIPTEPIPVSQRIITNFYTAKRLIYALQLTIERHEKTFGAVEPNLDRRARPGRRT